MYSMKIKEEYKEWSIGGGKLKTIKLKNMDPSLYEVYYKNGYSEFFEVEKKKSIKIERQEDDTNRQESN